MKMMKGMTVALVGLMAAGAMAETNTAATPAKKKIVQKKSISRKAVTTKKEAKSDSLTLPQSSAISASNATTSMPALTAGTSAAEAPKSMKKKSALDNIRAGVLLEYYGSSVADPFSGQQTDRETGFSQGAFPTELDTRVTLGYALSSNMTLSYNAYFWTYAESAPGENDGETFGFRPADSFLRLNFGKFLQVGRFKWNGDFRAYPGLGVNGDRTPLYLRTGQNFSYALSPRLTLAAYNTIRYYHRTSSAYAPDKDPTGNKIDWRATLGPALEYQMLDTVGLSLSFNTEFSHTYNNNTIDETANFKPSPVDQLYRAYFELGSSIDVTKSINFNPYIDMFTKTPNIEAMQFGANLNFTVL